MPMCCAKCYANVPPDQVLKKLNVYLKMLNREQPDETKNNICSCCVPVVLVIPQFLVAVATILQFFFLHIWSYLIPT